MGELYLKVYNFFFSTFGENNLAFISRGELEIFRLGLLPRIFNTIFGRKNWPHLLKGGLSEPRFPMFCVLSFQHSKCHEIDKRKKYEQKLTTKRRKRRPQSQQQVKMYNPETQTQSWGSHRSVATGFNNEAIKQHVERSRHNFRSRHQQAKPGSNTSHPKAEFFGNFEPETLAELNGD